MADFTARFGVMVLGGYGSSEGGIALVPARKPGSLGQAQPGADIAVVDSSGAECERAQFDAGGRLRNAARAIGELVRRNAGGGFEGYWNNPEAESDRLRGGWFWSGDLAYRDDDDVFWFAGRVGDWLRVDSENFAASARWNVSSADTDPPLPSPWSACRIRWPVTRSWRSSNSSRPRLRSSRLHRIPEHAKRSRHQMGTAVRARHHGHSGARQRQDRQEAAPPGCVAGRGSGVVAAAPVASAYTPMTSTDRDWLREQFEVHDRMGAFPSPASESARPTIGTRVPVHYEVGKRSDAPNVVLITLDRPEAKNACDLEHFHQLSQAWKRFAADDDAWVAIFTGVGRCLHVRGRPQDLRSGDHRAGEADQGRAPPRGRRDMRSPTAPMRCCAAARSTSPSSRRSTGHASPEAWRCSAGSTSG